MKRRKKLPFALKEGWQEGSIAWFWSSFCEVKRYPFKYFLLFADAPLILALVASSAG
jgi:hypothetical protein